MKNVHFLKLLLLLLLSDPIYAINYRSGENITIDTSLTDDSYIACQNFTLQAPAWADLIVAAQNIAIHDSVRGDLMLAAETINVNSYVGDDARIFCRTFTFNGYIKGDLIVFSGDVIIAAGAVVEGAIILYSGNIHNQGLVKGDVVIRGEKVFMEGTIEGNTSIKARELTMNGVVRGNASIAAEKITLGENYTFGGKVNYWQKEGPLQTDPAKVSEKPVYDPSLDDRMYPEEKNKWVGKLTFTIGHLLYGALLITLSSLFLPNLFIRSGSYIDLRPLKSFGVGILYFIGTPFVVLFLLIIVIGIPIGLLLFSIYIFTLFSGLVIASLAIAAFIRNRFHKNWKPMEMAGIALLVLLALHLLLWIPVAGFLASVFFVATTFGALIMNLKKPEAEKSF